MGRESKFLLSLLGLLAGIFVTALALRLLIPRPPEGTGPDIHTMTFNPFSETVSPPDLTPRPENNSPQQERTVSDVEQKQPRFPNIEASFEPSYVQTQMNELPLPAIKLDTPPTLEPVNKTLSPDVQAPMFRPLMPKDFPTLNIKTPRRGRQRKQYNHFLKHPQNL